MKNNFIMRTISMVLLISILYCQTLLPAMAAGAQTVTFSMPTVSAKRGDTITIPVYVSSVPSTPIAFGGISFNMAYDPQKLSYIDGSAQMPVSAMSDATIYNNTALSKVNVAWFTDDVLSVSSGTKLFNIQFKVLENAISGAASLTFGVDSMYTFSVVSGNVVWEDLILSQSSVSGNVNVGAEDSNVQNTIAAINSIGVVSYTDDCLAKITAAAIAYSILSNSQKAQVSNYQTLLNAQAEYDSLKTGSSENAVNQEIQTFLTTNAAALALTLDTVKISDESIVTAAYNSFNRLSVAAKYEIYRYNAQLKAITAKISVLKKDEADRLAAEEEAKIQRAEAQQYAQTFREQKAYFLTLDPKELIAEQYSGISDAIENLNMLSEINPYVGELLTSERTILENLMKLVEAIIEAEGKGESASIIAANKFKRNFGWVLSQTTESISADDALDVNLALEVYKMQDAETQALLKSEYTLLGNLLMQISLISDNDTVNSPVETPATQTNTQTNQVTNPGKTIIVQKNQNEDIKLNFANREMGMVVWVLLLLMLLSAIVFATLQIFYHRFYKKKFEQYKIGQFEEEADAQ